MPELGPNWQLAEAAYNGGWTRLVPLYTGTKRPAGGENWNVGLPWLWDKLLKWSHGTGAQSIGYSPGTESLWFDHDRGDKDALAEFIFILTEIVGAPPLVRLGRPFRAMLGYRTDGKIERSAQRVALAVTTYQASGNQLVIFGRHPDTGKDYTWVDDKSPATVPLSDVPLLSQAHYEDIFETFNRGMPMFRDKNGQHSGIVSTFIKENRDLEVSAGLCPLPRIARALSRTHKGHRHETLLAAALIARMKGYSLADTAVALEPAFKWAFRDNAAEGDVRWCADWNGVARWLKAHPSDDEEI